MSDTPSEPRDGNSLPAALWVSPVSNLAGVARHILDVAGVGVAGWRLTFAVPAGPLFDALSAMGYEVHELPMANGTRAQVLSLRSIITQVQPQIIHTHLAKADFLATMATPGLKVKLVSTEHGIPMHPLVYHGNRVKAGLRQVAHHARIRRFDHLIAVSEATKATMLKYWRASAPITVVLNGVDRPSVQPQHSPGLRVLSLTRLSSEKNLPMTLEAFAQVLAAHPEATLTLAGEGPDRPALEALVKTMGLSNAVSMPGFVDAEEALTNHDVLLQPSKSENLSYTLLDGVARGMGVVASPVGGNPEILPSRCLAAHDDPTAMARAVVEQGTDLSARPTLPESIPTVAEMSRGIARVYGVVN